MQTKYSTVFQSALHYNRLTSQQKSLRPIGLNHCVTRLFSKIPGFSNRVKNLENRTQKSLKDSESCCNGSCGDTTEESDDGRMPITIVNLCILSH